MTTRKTSTNKAENNIEILVKGRMIDKKKREKAGKTIQKLQRKVKNFDTTGEIRKWREI